MDETERVLTRILGSFDVDIYATGSHFTGLTFTGRLWEGGETVCECEGKSVGEVLGLLDMNAEALVAAYNS